MADTNSMSNVHSPAEVLADINADRSAEIIGGSVVLIVLPTIFVILRLMSRWMAQANLWWDDYTVILGLVFSLGPNIIDLLGISHGFGKHIYTLPIYGILDFFKYLYAFELLYVFAMSSVKFSIILFQYRIFPIARYRRVLKIWAVFTACLTLSSTLVCIFQCIPVSGFWTHFAGAIPGARCVNVTKFIIIAGSINAATDFILLAMPIPLLWKLRTGTLQKLLLTGIFGVGLVVCSVSIVRLVLLSEFSQADITWNYVPPAIWTAAEPSIGVISGCLPSLRPLFAKLVWGRSYRPKMLSSRSSRGYAVTGSNSNGGGSSSGGWRSAGGAGSGAAHHLRSDSFNRLQDGFQHHSTTTNKNGSSEESGGGGGGGKSIVLEAPWRHRAHVRAGGGRRHLDRHTPQRRWRRRGSNKKDEENYISHHDDYDDDDDDDEVMVGSGNESGDKRGGGGGGIRVKTTVTVTEKVDWLDDLY